MAMSSPAWDDITTAPVAHFVAQPNLGKKPLWVWFTDMSIAGANWNWNFGDSTSSTSRSPYHNFTSTGEFQVSQQISGPSTYSQTITVLDTFMLEGEEFTGNAPFALAGRLMHAWFAGALRINPVRARGRGL